MPKRIINIDLLYICEKIDYKLTLMIRYIYNILNS